MKVTNLTVAQKAEAATLKAAVTAARNSLAAANAALTAYLISIAGKSSARSLRGPVISDDGSSIVS